MAILDDPSNEASLRLSVEGLPEGSARVVRFHGHEGISELRAFSVEFASPDSGIPIEEVTGRRACLGFRRHGAERRVSGIVARLQHVRAGARRSHYVLDLVPSVWILTQRTRCRVFQDLSTPEIVAEVLADAGIARDRLRADLAGEYGRRGYCVQYRESDWAFVARLLEEEGVHFTFEEGPDGEVLVLGDAVAELDPVDGDPVVPLAAPGGNVTTRDALSSFSVSHEVRSGAVRLRDYAFRSPRQDLEAASGDGGDGRLEVYDYPGEYVSAPLGRRLAQVRAEELTAERLVARGEGDCARIQAGRRFSLTGHPRRAADGEYLVISADHSGEEAASLGEEAGGDVGESYRCTFLCIPGDVAWRPPRRTPHPVVHGVQTAVVTGPEGEEIHTDEFGRVKVKFHWDWGRSPRDRTSCWIRVAHGMAGARYGMLFLPRIGHEVVVAFLEGDPDRPLIVGSVYNQDQMPPYGLPADKTKSTVKSDSSIGGGGSNELRFEDRKGREQVFVHAQRNMDTEVGNDQSLSVGSNRSATVGANESDSVGGNRSVSVGGNESKSVGGDRTVNVAANETKTIGANRTLAVGGGEDVRVGSSRSVDVGSNQTTKVGMMSNELVGAVKTTTVAGAYAIQVGGAMNIAVGGLSAEEVGLVKKIVAGSSIEFVCGDSSIRLDSGGAVTIRGTSFAFECSGPTKITGSPIDLNPPG